MPFSTNNLTPGQCGRRASGSAGVPPADSRVSRESSDVEDRPSANDASRDSGVPGETPGTGRRDARATQRHAVLLSVRLLMRDGMIAFSQSDPATHGAGRPLPL